MSALNRARPLRWGSRTLLESALLSALFLGLLAASASAQQPYAGGGAAECLECHENENVMGILETPHADFDVPRSPASGKQCESCHGPSATHMQFPMQVGNIMFTKHGKTSIAQRNVRNSATSPIGSMQRMTGAGPSVPAGSSAVPS